MTGKLMQLDKEEVHYLMWGGCATVR